MYTDFTDFNIKVLGNAPRAPFLYGLQRPSLTPPHNPTLKLLASTLTKMRTIDVKLICSFYGSLGTFLCYLTSRFEKNSRKGSLVLRVD